MLRDRGAARSRRRRLAAGRRAARACRRSVAGDHRRSPGHAADEERTFIQDAAVIGRTAWIGAVCATSTARSRRGRPRSCCTRSSGSSCVRRARRSSVAGEVEFSFAHALTQEVAYSQIRRARTGPTGTSAPPTWIARLAGERDDKAELLAHHYPTALALRRRAGADTAELTIKARDAPHRGGPPGAGRERVRRRRPPPALPPLT